MDGLWEGGDKMFHSTSMQVLNIVFQTKTEYAFDDVKMGICWRWFEITGMREVKLG